MSRYTPRRPSPLDLLAQAQRVAEAAGARPTPPAAPAPGATALDARGYRRSVATLPDFHRGRAPSNKGRRIKANPPTVAECMRMLSACPADIYGRRMYAAIMLMWQGALRAAEALAITDGNLDEATGAIHIEHGKGDKAATIKMAAWAWPYLTEWREIRRGLPDPAGALLCVITGPTAGRAWSYPDLNRSLKGVALDAGVTKRMSCHQLRHGWAVHAYQAQIPLRAIQLHLRHENIGITDTYLQGLGVAESQQQVYDQAIPVVPATVLLELRT